MKPRINEAYGCLPIVVTFIIVFALMFFAVWRNPAHAQDGGFILVRIPCNNTKTLLKMLDEKYHELPISGGVSSKNESVRLFTSHTAEGDQTWSVVVTNVNGISCMLSNGGDWTEELKIIKGDPS